MTQTLTPLEARKLVLLSQWPPRDPPPRPTGPAATLAVLQHLGYIQLDTLQIITRAHHHTFWNRHPRYHPDHLDHLIRHRHAFEYWSHAAAILPMTDYRFTLPRKRTYANGRRHWYPLQPKLMRQILTRIRTEGPLRAQDFTRLTPTKKTQIWESTPIKRALEQLFMAGKLMTTHRHNFQKVYDLTSRVLPSDIDTRMPTPTEHAHFLITRYLRANGIGRAPEIAYQLPEYRPQITTTLDTLTRRGTLIPLKIHGNPHTYHTLPATLNLLNRPSPRRLRILSPFDNLLIQRPRTLDLFAFDYRLECYTPPTHRQHGTFALPILWGTNLVARLDCKAHRPTHTLHLHHLHLEPSITNPSPLITTLATTLLPFAHLNHCPHITTNTNTTTSHLHLLHTTLHPHTTE